MKTLVIVTHPNMQDSVINKRWIQELEKYPDQFTIHELYKVYPDENINVEQEQALVEAHDHIVFQFPLYWFNCPPLLKKWLDEVLTYGWAYGSTGKHFTDRKVAIAVTVGVSEADYQPDGKYRYTLEQILLPFEMTFDYIHALYQGFTAFYSAEHESTPVRIEENISEYIHFLQHI
ncbi:putative NADPH-quinone reductase [Paenibacillus sp. SORGH_AS306]|uniref:NAD(P)H-dependent oxidoreductase n=1 Tax=unclassified Paenibacillus TaxID=185978 RepID=UPI00277D72DA|nr:MULTISPECIES: NAD(P)H-dependent oxidoreductase [unclassified Paenibacillus]MDQ1234680.1 putative NADPH-quinone reductase [Paenibacillus sp. SORGH_AS_0306]MDR6111725.1 putative NADPH-quinone reductase [Paenibacillus sp. SORGH_AS_0338]